METGVFGVSAGLALLGASHAVPEAGVVSLVLGTAFCIAGTIVVALFGRKAEVRREA